MSSCSSSGGSSRSRDSSAGGGEQGRGLVLSVSALAGAGARLPGPGEEEETELPPPVRLEPEGTEEESQAIPFTSFLSVDKRLFGRLQEELTQAQSELKLKEEQVVKLSRIRDDVERELEDLTASLFQEAHKMVQEANMKRAQAEKSLAESDMKVDGLETEVAALKALVITSTPSMPNREASSSHHHRLAEGGESAPSSPARGRGGSEGGAAEEETRLLDPVLRSEYLAWKKCPSLEVTAHPFLARIYSEDVRPCLQFPAQALGKAVTDAIHSNTLCLSPVKPDTAEQPRNCALLDQPRTARYKLRIDGAEPGEHFICQLARNRLAAVGDFLTYCRYVTLGMVKSPSNDVYWEIMELRRKMVNARLGFSL